MGAEQECSLFRSSEIVSMARESATVTWTVPSTPCEGDAQFCERPDALGLYF